MAYVLVAVGALMAAAGLYTIGYSALNARFDEYWTALGAGATLVAGGVVTVALGVAIRALSQLKAVLVVQPLATRPVEAAPPANEVAPHAVEEPVTAPAVPQADLAPPALETPLAHEPVETEPAIPRASPLFPMPPANIVPPPLRQALPSLAQSAAHERVPESATLFTAPRPARPEPMGPPRRPEPPPPLPEPSYPALEPHEASLLAHDPLDAPPAEPEPSAVQSARPADDYKLETPSTSEHDLPAFDPVRPPAAPPPPPTPEMPDDWLDRAFAALDEELPVGPPPNRTPVPAAMPRPEPPPRPATPEPEPVLAPIMAEPPPAQHQAQPVAPPPSPVSTPAVIGRYEADGTAYVMYADGSIEAQSSSGVYRFASMAELRSYIEN